MSTILINGCSLTYGYELVVRDEFKNLLADQEDAYPENIAYRLQYRWASIFKGEFGFRDINDQSMPGSSNSRIFRTTMDALLGGPVDFALIGWTYPHRTEFYENRTSTWHNFVNTSDRIQGWKLSAFHKLYFDAFLETYDIHWQKMRRYQLTLAAYLESVKIPYLFVYCGGSETNGFDATTATYIDAINKNSRIMKGINFNTFAEGYSRGPRGHPLEEANRDWARVVINYTKVNNLMRKVK